MSNSQKNGRALSIRVPDAVRAIGAELERDGHRAWLVGEPLCELARGEEPRAFEIATSAPATRCLALFGRSVPTDWEHGIVTVPTPQSPVDIVPFQRGALEDDLSARDFTMLAMAFCPTRGELVDPHGGMQDLEDGLLRAVGPPENCIDADPLRALRAVRLVSEYGYTLEPALEAALGRAGRSLRRVTPIRKRRELTRLLLGPHASRALLVLRSSGLERRLSKKPPLGSVLLVDAMPVSLEVRMAAWLRGTRPARLMRELRFGRERASRIERLLDHHPLDTTVFPHRDRSLLRLRRALSEQEIDALFAMREWELEHESADRTEFERATAQKTLEAIREGMARVARNERAGKSRVELAIDGAAIMKLLDCGPGPRVGAALRHAAVWIHESPDANTQAQLAEEILDWARLHPNPTDDSTDPTDEVIP